jgi:hypothetical protein
VPLLADDDVVVHGNAKRLGDRDDRLPRIADPWIFAYNATPIRSASGLKVSPSQEEIQK